MQAVRFPRDYAARAAQSIPVPPAGLPPQSSSDFGLFPHFPFLAPLLYPATVQHDLTQSVLSTSS